MAVVNFHHYGSQRALDEAYGKDGWMYVGRRNIGFALAQSPLANPFVDRRGKMGTVVSDPIGEYKKWLWARIKAGDKGVIGVLSTITPQTALVCWCHPSPCHADVIAKAAAWWHSQQERPMKALSVQQPWAWLIVNGYKDIENRTWATTFRGRFWVHAGKKVEKAGYEFLREHFPELYTICPPAKEIERGGLVGQTTITDCVERSESRWFLGPKGFVLSDSHPHPLIPLAGRLGFFEVNL